MPTDFCFGDIDLHAKWPCLWGRWSQCPRRRAGCAAPPEPDGRLCVYSSQALRAKAARGRAEAIRRAGLVAPTIPLSSLQHSSIPRARFPVLLPTLMHRPREGLTQPLALHGMISKLKRHSMSESAVQGSAPSSPPQHESAGPQPSPHR